METIVFLCNGDAEYYMGTRIIKNRELPGLIKSVISSGDYYRTSWSCGNSKFIKVGDRAYLQRSGNIGNQPSGFIAAGYVIAAPEDEQLRLLDSRYSDLSKAYISDYDGYFAVNLQIDSVVDFNFPLKQKYLKKLPQFQGINFNFGGSGCRFNSKSVSSLDSEWEKHSLIQQRQGRGRRLVDIFFEQGEDFKQKKEYQAAIDAYKLALKVDSKYSKAINKIKHCEDILNPKGKNFQHPEPSIQSIETEPIPEMNELLLARETLEQDKFFIVKSDADARQKITVSIARRQGQSKFRQSLLDAYSCKCAITNFDAEEALEAAHIIPYVETENNHPSNGLLLRADLHTLFDLNLIVIHPETIKIYIAPTLHKTEYREINGRELRVPKNEIYRPKQKFLKQRFEQCQWCQDK
ncbi:TPR repeat-containing protein [Calothrix sp. NIES-2100]|uniref:HNH endonuclease n=1 Tax=Calothrix sp. NIES-2100 TaxID=1954172 RepID=UPI000B5EC283|nr:TPR repeat-containing protein [Calothrix sp. NIES-2100]